MAQKLGLAEAIDERLRLVSLQHREVLYWVIRLGYSVSHASCVPWMNRAIATVRPHAQRV